MFFFVSFSCFSLALNIVFLYLVRPHSNPLELFYDLLVCQAQFLKGGLALFHEQNFVPFLYFKKYFTLSMYCLESHFVLSLLYIEGATIFCQDSAPDFVSSSCVFLGKKTFCFK